MQLDFELANIVLVLIEIMRLLISTLTTVEELIIWRVTKKHGRLSWTLGLSLFINANFSA